MAERIATVSRALNQVQSVGQARAALGQAWLELEVGNTLADGLSYWSTPSESEARTLLSQLRGQVEASLTTIGAQADGDQIDPTTWSRLRTLITTCYVEVSGIEGTAGAVARINVGEILLDAVVGAPKVIGAAVGATVGAIGQTAGGLVGGVLGGLGVWGFLLLALVIGVVVLGKVK